MSVSTRYVVSFAVIGVAAFFSEIYCRDATYIKQSQSNWASPSWDRKNTTTPWPALGTNYRINNNPTWVRPNNSLSWQRRDPNPHFNTGSSNRQDSKISSSNSPSQSVSSSDVTDDELREFAEELLRKDVNNAARHVNVNVQRKTTSRSQNDEAPLPLLQIDREAFRIPSIEKMMLLHNNYVLQSNVDEQYTNQERQEEENLLDAVVDTPVMQHTRNFLIQKGKIGHNTKEFKDRLREIWFNMYARGGGKVGSSGFEHVFIAEIKKNEVSGLHNWLYFNEEEQKKTANYLGYMRKLDLGGKGAILKFHFTFHGIDKPVDSMFIGTSPEFEMALYSTCFLLRADKICPLKLNGNRFIIRTYTYRYRGKNLIGSAFPEI